MDGSGSFDNDPGDALAFRWDVNGDGTFDVTSETPTLAWADLVTLGIEDGPTSLTVTLEVSDSSDTDTDSAVLTVNNAPPIAILSNSGPVDEGSTATVGLELIITV